MKKNDVLIPIDGAEFSLQILPYVRRFLNPTENRLILLHVEQEPEAIHIRQPGLEDLDIYVDESEAALRDCFADELLTTVRALEKMGFDVTTDVEFGKPIPKIEAYIKQKKVDLVAMTTHGRTGWNRIRHGSVAEHLLHHVAVPVLLVHPTQEHPADEREQAGVMPLL